MQPLVAPIRSNKYFQPTHARTRLNWSRSFAAEVLDVSQMGDSRVVTDFSIRRFGAYTDDELVSCLRDFATDSGTDFVSGRAFSAFSGVSEATIVNHFGSWAAFCEQAGLSPRYRRNVSRDDLFWNLDAVWQRLGRQPRAKEMRQPLSPVSVSKYQKEFGEPWHGVCLRFLAWRSGLQVDEIERQSRPTPAASAARRTRRGIPLSLRYEVMKRDSFRCVKCGRSPATDPTVQLHIDHAVPWSRGGESEPDNLQCLCSDCNLGKSDRSTG